MPDVYFSPFQYPARSGSTQRTPPRGSPTSPARRGIRMPFEAREFPRLTGMRNRLIHDYFDVGLQAEGASRSR
jgi:hypothetical protein